MGQIVRSFTDDGIEFFSRDKVSDLIIVGMTKYFESPNLLAAFPMPEIKNSLAEVLSIYQKKQLHIAETEKYAHVTYFFNCLQDKAFTGETDILIKSARDPKDNPEMMAYEITAKAIESINQDAYDFLLINFANADFVAHTGSLDKTVRGVEVVDSCVGKLKDSVFAKNGILIITSDHGNAESLTYKGGEEETRHNMNPVPFYMVVKEYERPRSEDEIRQTMSGAKGIIADIAPTILEILGISKPEEMTGTSLFNLL